MSEEERRGSPAGLAVVLIAGLVLRALVIATTSGTSDLWLWPTFSDALQVYGLRAYAHVSRLNHPPLGAVLVWGLSRIGPLAITLRASQALADVVAAVSIGEIARHFNVDRRFSAAVYFLSPVTILTSSFFCNTDSTLVALLAVAVWMFLDRRYALCGVILACACGVKIVPILTLPLFFLAARDGRKRFVTAFVLTCGVIFLPVLAFAPLDFARNVLGYRGSGEMWGLALPATLAGAAATVLKWTRFRAMSYAFGDFYIGITRYCVLAIVALVTWLWWRRGDRDLVPAAMTLLFLGATAVAPRVTLGYFLWFLPFLPFTFSRSTTLLLHSVASLQLMADYRLFSLGTHPWFVNLGNTTNPWWLGRAIDALGVPLWCFCVWLLIRGLYAMNQQFRSKGRYSEPSVSHR